MVRKRIIWFSKRPPIIEQTEELKKLLDGGDITTDLLVKESRVKFDSMVEVTQAANIIFNAINRALANGVSPSDIIIAGSFPPALTEALQDGNRSGKEIRLMESWSIKTERNGEPYYVHKKFCKIGVIKVQE